MRLVQRTLPIALARPFVEQFVPEGTKVNWHYYHRIIDRLYIRGWVGNQDVIAWLLNKNKVSEVRIQEICMILLQLFMRYNACIA